MADEQKPRLCLRTGRPVCQELFRVIPWEFMSTQHDLTPPPGGCSECKEAKSTES